MNDAYPQTGLALEFVALNEQIGDGATRDEAFRRLVLLAVDDIPGCDWAAITEWPLDSEPVSVAATDEIAIAADRTQYALGEGPCLTAAEDSEAVIAPDLATDGRWPRFAAETRATTPVRGVASFHLVDTPNRCALNLYSGAAGAFDDHAVAVAVFFAAHARISLIHSVSAVKTANLNRALVTSRQIGTAIGILMSIHKVTADQAFTMLREASQHLHRKLYDVAEDVQTTGALPER